MAVIFIVDDQPVIRQLYIDELADDGHLVYGLGEIGSIKKMLKDNKPDLVLLDLYINGFNGWLVLNYIKENMPDIPVVILSAYDSYINDIRLNKADGYIVKDLFSFHFLKQKIHDILRRKFSLAN